MKILVINGPNLNMLGRRDPVHYGGLTMADIEAGLSSLAAEMNVTVSCYQSNHEGAIIDHIQKESPAAAGIIINPGALAHYGYSLHDALLDCGLPVIEVHLSDITNREEWRRRSVTAAACIKVISGLKEASYYEGLRELVKHIGETA